MKKVLNAIGTIAIIAGVVLLIGAAGASDCNTYTTYQVLIQVGVSAFLVSAGLLVKHIVNK